MATGNDFARKQLSKHGWKEGSGLGRKESGIKEAIKVQLKYDKCGMGHNQGDEFTFHWWDHVFNKAASSINVENNENGIEVKKTTENGPITNRKGKTYADKSMLYGQFVKGATLDNSVETKCDDDVEEGESSEDEQVLNKLDDEAMMKICGGMTAHKAARHGLKLSGKLVRLQEQEKALLEKYGRKPNNESYHSRADNSLGCDTDQAKLSKKKKKKKMRREVQETEDCSETLSLKSEVCDNDKVSKKKKRHKDILDDENRQSPKKPKKNEVKNLGCTLTADSTTKKCDKSDDVLTVGNNDVLTVGNDNHIVCDEKIKRKKKKKKKSNKSILD